MMWSKSLDFFPKASRRDCMEGMRDSWISSTAAMCMTVGKLSLEEADMLT